MTTLEHARQVDASSTHGFQKRLTAAFLTWQCGFDNKEGVNNTDTAVLDAL
jgi:hypothetical protein